MAAHRRHVRFDCARMLMPYAGTMLGRTRLLAVAVPVVALVHMVACGTEDDSKFHEDGGSSGSSGTSGSNADGSNGGNISSGGGNGGDGATNLGDGAACEGAVARAEKLPVQMLILLDQSGSMGDHGGPSPHTNKATRWVPVTTALAGFLGDPVSAGITADLRYFPKVSERQEGGDYAIVPANQTLNCTKANYVTPDVPLTALPNAAAFDFPDNATFYSTPTLPALQATVDEATALTASTPNAKTVIVLVTDGEPSGCTGNTVQANADAVSGQPFLTYVIGVGNEGGLNQVAAAGGTDHAIVVDVAAGAAASQAQFTAAIEDIRRQALSCELPIPPPPAGKTFDRDKVNVSVSTGAGATQLTYDPTCAGAGWRYDDATAPTLIVLCPATCEPAKNNPDTQVDVAFGCATRSGPN